MRRQTILGTCLLVGLGLTTLPGCGGGAKDDSGDYHVSGKVTFAGKDIPAGKIFFTPDGAKDNSGPSGFAEIEDGKYDTSAAGGRATVAGPSKIRIEGFDPDAKVTVEGGEETVKALFPTYQTTDDLPAGGGTKDFDVPAAAANVKNVGEGGGGIIP